MFTIDDIIQAYTGCKNLPQSFTDKVRQISKQDSNDWDYRTTQCAKSILTAVCFRETAIASAESTDSMIYQPIGLYYSMFHMSLAMLWINPRVRKIQLTEIHHNTLINLVKSNLVDARLLKPSFESLLTSLKKLRESCNYQFGYQEDLNIVLVDAIEKTESEFDMAIEYIHQVLDVSKSLFRVQVEIGDGFGHDILDSYLSKEHKENVIHYLATHGLRGCLKRMRSCKFNASRIQLA